MTLNNHVIPFQLSNNTIRGNIVRLQTVVSEIVKRHEYPENIESLSKKELREIADENGNVKVVCEFCKKERIFAS